MKSYYSYLFDLTPTEGEGVASLGFTSRLFRARQAAFWRWRLVFVSASQ
jgi:hypothetical protein